MDQPDPIRSALEAAAHKLREFQPHYAGIVQQSLTRVADQVDAAAKLLANQGCDLPALELLRELYFTHPVRMAMSKELFRRVQSMLQAPPEEPAHIIPRGQQPERRTQLCAIEGCCEPVAAEARSCCTQHWAEFREWRAAK